MFILEGLGDLILLPQGFFVEPDKRGHTGTRFGRSRLSFVPGMIGAYSKPSDEGLKIVLSCFNARFNGDQVLHVDRVFAGDLAHRELPLTTLIFSIANQTQGKDRELPLEVGWHAACTINR
jgi:hypothetical protein